MNEKKSRVMKWRRKQYVIDMPVQIGVTGHLLAGLGGVALLCAAALYVFLGSQSVPGLDPLMQFLIAANATYFILAAGILTLMTLLLTHRFAGPAYVFRLAIRGMLEGDFSRRLKLRKKDYHKDLASDLAGLRQFWVDHEDHQRKLLEELEVAVRANDKGEAQRIVDRLRDTLIVDPQKKPQPFVPDDDENPASQPEPAQPPQTAEAEATA